MATAFLSEDERRPYRDRFLRFDDITISATMDSLWATRDEAGRAGRGAESLAAFERYGLLSVFRQDVIRARWQRLPHEATEGGIQIEALGVFDGVTWRLKRNLNNRSHGRTGWRILSFHDAAGNLIHSAAIERTRWDGHCGGMLLVPGYVAAIKRKQQPVDDAEAAKELEALLDEVYEVATRMEAA